MLNQTWFFKMILAWVHRGRLRVGSLAWVPLIMPLLMLMLSPHQNNTFVMTLYVSVTVRSCLFLVLAKHHFLPYLDLFLCPVFFMFLDYLCPYYPFKKLRLKIMCSLNFTPHIFFVKDISPKRSFYGVRARVAYFLYQCLLQFISVCISFCSSVYFCLAWVLGSSTLSSSKSYFEVLFG